MSAQTTHAVGSSSGARRAAAPAAKPRGGPPGVKKIVMAGSAYLIAPIFITPYLEMIVTAARPVNETSDATILPRHWQWSNFTTVFDGGFGTNIMGPWRWPSGDLPGAARRPPGGALHARARFRGRRCSCCWCW